MRGTELFNAKKLVYKSDKGMQHSNLDILHTQVVDYV